MLSVKIKNTAESAYQREVYDDAIIVERHFSRSGSSGFKLKSHNGRLISTRKGDLEEICDYFALQIDNPMNVLTQDMARQFLNNSSPFDKYKFFMKGTQLEALDGDYQIFARNLEMIDMDLWKKHQDVKVFDERKQKAIGLLALAKKQDTLRDRIQHLRKMIAWAQVAEQEDILEGYVTTSQKIADKLEALEMKANGLSEAFSQTDQAHEKADRAVGQVQNALAPLEEKKDQVKAEHEKSKNERMSLQVF